ncbi:hypothetical protein [Aliarcobacter butzleri]|uniref:hypothetical protein n=1 Tax=Aliarcobacter butzleri TaxID=28197 RepID=UPI001260D468|nr:hypothetical protein [Aliarcobacter butzleri]
METTTLEIIDVIGTWIAAIGTVGAVITSLWFSLNANRDKLKIKASAMLQGSIPKKEPPLLLCVITIVNIGNIQSKINVIGWEIGRGKKKKTFIQNTNGSIQDNTPKILQQGEEAIITFECNDKWLNKMAKDLKGYKTKDLKVIVSTALNSFKTKIDNSLVIELEKKKNDLKENL